MRPVLRFFLRGRPMHVATVTAIALLIMLWLSLAVSGSFSNLDFGEEQNIEFGDALGAQPPLPAMVAARDQVDPQFAAQMRDQLAATANRLLQSEQPLDLEGTRPAGVAQAEWMDEFVCGLKGWRRNERAVVRRLVVEGFGECGWMARARARSPAIYDRGGWGEALVLLSWLALLGLAALALLLRLVRRAYNWLYASRTH